MSTVAFAALVPAEVLTAHGVILTFTTKTANDGQVTVTNVDPLFYSFLALIMVSMLLYATGRLVASRWDQWDFVRVLIPPLAFVGWTMVQKASAFDAVKLHWSLTFSDAAQSATAIVGALVLGVLASGLAYKADQKPV